MNIHDHPAAAILAHAAVSKVGENLALSA